MTDTTRITAEAMVASVTHFDLVGHDDAPEAQVCRTCVFQNKRLHLQTPLSMLQAKKRGEKLDDYKCAPAKFGTQRNVYGDATTQVALNDGSVPVRLVKKGEAVKAKVETCGQVLQDKCKGCARLVRQTISVEGGKNSNGRAWYREVLIGGHCSIPAEGIEKNGSVVFCDRVQMKQREVEQSCYTCGNNQSFGSNWMMDHGTPQEVDLTAYEMERARLGAPADEVGLAIWQARQRKGRTLAPITPTSNQRSLAAYGLQKFYLADVLDTIKRPVWETMEPARYEPDAKIVHVHEDPQYGTYITPKMNRVRDAVRRKVGEEICGYKLQFRQGGFVVELSIHESDLKVGVVHDCPNPTVKVVEILSPYHRYYGLPDNERIQRRIHPTEECAQCHGEVTKRGTLWNSLGCSLCSGTGKVSTLPLNVPKAPDLDHLVDEDCVRCADMLPGKPCYFHAKAPRLKEVADGTDLAFMRPNHFQARARNVALQIWDGKVVDQDGEEPHVTAFRVQLPSLLARRGVDRQAILRQYFAAEKLCEKGRVRTVNLGFGRFMDVEPWKPYCTLNLSDPTQGIDFRAAMGDWFGEPRAHQLTNPLYGRETPTDVSHTYYSWSKHMEREDWERITNSGERIQEEIVRNDHLVRARRKNDKRFDRFGNRIEPFTMEVTSHVEVPMHGVDDADMTTEEYVEWLNELVEVPIGETGETMMVTRRWLNYGYEMRGRSSANKRMKVTSNQADAEVAKFNHDIDEMHEVGMLIGFRCTAPSCGEHYAADEVGDPLEPVCTKVVFMDRETDEVRTCGAPLRWVEDVREWEQGHMKMTGDRNPDDPYRRVGSPTLAGGPDSRRWQQDERLLNMSCANWRPKPWVRGRRQPVAAKTTTEVQNVTVDTSVWLGRQIDLILDGEKMSLVVGVDVKMDTPLMQAIMGADGDDRLRYRGGKGHWISGKILAVTTTN